MYLTCMQLSLYRCRYPYGEAGAFMVLGFCADVASECLGEFFGYGEAYAYAGREGTVTPEDIKYVLDKLLFYAIT